MLSTGKKEAFFLLSGDILFLYVSLWLTLAVRYLNVPSERVLDAHVVPFTILIAVWILSFFIAGLYDKHTLLFRRKLPSIFLRTQTLNSALAVLFFYFIPYFTIAPKTNLFIYLVISFTLILLWRLYGINALGVGRRHEALLIGSGREMQELLDEVNENPRYPFRFASFIDLGTTEADVIVKKTKDAALLGTLSFIVADLRHKKMESVLPALYDVSVSSQVRLVDFQTAYAGVFDRIPISLVNYGWVLGNINPEAHVFYDVLKRGMDILGALILGALSLVLYPLVFAAIKIEGTEPVFLVQKRVGKNNKIIKIIKFRTMRVADRGKWVVKNDPRITRVGAFLRKSRIDELPQLWNVLKGDLSLVGPRPELPDLVRLYEEKVPYYGIRHLIKPGLSGWGQIHHEKPPHSIEETKEKLSYDLFYIKNRSVLLDLEIALKTIRLLLSRTGI